MNKYSHIGIIMNGGDAPGLNSALLAASSFLLSKGMKVSGISRGLKGLTDPQIPLVNIDYNYLNQSYWLDQTSGSILGSYVSPIGDVKKDIIKDQIKQVLDLHKIEALILFGGDGTFKFLGGIFNELNLNWIGIPKSIDNDIPGTDYAIGSASAVRSAVQAIDSLRSTAFSHNRIMVLEIMGRDSGYLALKSGISAMADIILIPEIRYDIQKTIDYIKSNHQKNHWIILVSESVKSPYTQEQIAEKNGNRNHYAGIGEAIEKYLSNRITNKELRSVRLGHIQRGGEVDHQDRFLAHLASNFAAKSLLEGVSGKIVAWQGKEIKAITLDETLAKNNTVDKMIKIAQELGIYLGE